MKAAIYARVSSEKQNTDSLTLDAVNRAQPPTDPRVRRFAEALGRELARQLVAEIRAGSLPDLTKGKQHEGRAVCPRIAHALEK